MARKVLRVGDEQGRVVGMRGEEGNVKLVGGCGVTGFGQHLSKHACDGGVGGVGFVEFLKQGKGFVLVLSYQDGGELGGESGVAGGLLQG